MRVVAKGASGEWDAWRVGRRRLAWRPVYMGWNLNDSVDMTGILLALNLLPFVFWLLNWLAALLTTVFVWPWRAVSGRWLVVAYTTTGNEPDRRAHVRGRAPADALAREWAKEIIGRPVCGLAARAAVSPLHADGPA
ncbi:hypothetical protein [Asanoa ishikariensis]|nr:hypothetical protein [Asanoa ishikariensis]